MRCLGDVVAALVDGELDHASRERAQRHLAHCGACRAEVDGQRRLKSRLTGLPAEPPDPELTARLLALTLPTADVVRAVVGRAASGGRSRPQPVRPQPVRPRSRPSTDVRPVGRSRRRRAATGTALVAFGLTAAFALGSPPPRVPTTPVDPGADTFVTEFVSTTSDVSPARHASLTPGGVGSGR